MAAAPQPWNDEVVLVGEIPNREFHEFSVRHGVYCIPVDESEENRLTEFHDILRSWDHRIGQLIYPEGVSPDTVLDCGCGSGIWAEQVLDGDDEREVVGVDLFLGRDFGYPTKRWNLNAPFRLDQEELSRHKYDLVNSRFLASGIDRLRWPGLVRDMFGRLRGGGWLQMTEAYMNIQSDAGRRDEAPNIGRWWELYSTALEQQGKDPRVGTTVISAGQRAWANLENLMRATGFVNIAADQPRLPIGDWSVDPNSREIGGRTLAVMRQTLESLGSWACCQVHGMSREGLHRLLDGCMREMENPDLHLYIQLYMVWGQKPHRNQMGASDVSASVEPSSQQSMPPPSAWKKT